MPRAVVFFAPRTPRSRPERAFCRLENAPKSARVFVPRERPPKSARARVFAPKQPQKKNNAFENTFENAFENAFRLERCNRSFRQPSQCSGKAQAGALQKSRHATTGGGALRDQPNPQGAYVFFVFCHFCKPDLISLQMRSGLQNEQTACGNGKNAPRLSVFRGKPPFFGPYPPETVRFPCICMYIFLFLSSFGGTIYKYLGGRQRPVFPFSGRRPSRRCLASVRACVLLG